MARQKSVAPAPAAVPPDVEELTRKRDAFVASMTGLQNAAEEAARTGLAWFDHIIGSPEEHTRSLMLMRGQTEEPEGPKKRAKRPKRDPNMPKKPMTAYLLFCSKGRELVKKDLGPDAPNSAVVAELTRRWSDTPADQKKAWQEVYIQSREKYVQEMADYKAGKLALASDPGAAAGSFTAVNQSNEADETDAESVKPLDHGEDESEAEEAEPEDEKDGDGNEEEDENESVEHSPSPPPPRKAKAPAARTRKAAAINGVRKGPNPTTTDPASSSLSSPSQPPTPDVAVVETPKRKRVRTKKVVDEIDGDEAARKKKPVRKRKKMD